MLNYQEYRAKIQSHEISSLEFVKSVFSKIDEEKHLNAFITVCNESAIGQALESDSRFAAGTARPLEGMIIAVKDNISTKGIRTTCGSRMLEHFEPVFDATVIEKIKSAGGIIIGKTNMDEFAMGSSSETSYFGAVEHPLSSDYVPGGSSGGSAVAVSAGLCHTALGSDTGGSVRQPAAFCGNFGLKPTYGSVSRFGLIAFASSLDQIGIFSSNAQDSALVLDVISGIDPKDSTSVVPKFLSDNSQSTMPSKFKFGIISEDLLAKCDLEIIKVYQRTIEKIIAIGGEPIQIRFENPVCWIPTYSIISSAEASSNLSRFDGIRFGFRADTSNDIITASRTQGFGTEVKRRIMLGNYVLSSGYYDAYYKKAQQVRRMIFNNYMEIFNQVDLILMPTTASPAFRRGERISDPISMYNSDFFTVSANLAGIPAVSFPAGESRSGFPVGMQLQAKHFGETFLLNAAAKLSVNPIYTLKLCD